MADEVVEKLKQTWGQKLLFYTTAFFILLGIFSLFAFLFLVPFVIDPAFTTIFMHFEERPALCVTVSTVTNRGVSNCTWSSCKEGCTRELYECTQISVNYKFDDSSYIGGSSTKEDINVVRRKRSALEYSLFKFAETYSSLFVKEREARAIRDYDYATSDVLEEEVEGLQYGNNSEWFYVGAKLFPNVKGCGYPPALNCTIFLKAYRTIGTNFTCYFSRIDPSLVIHEFDLHQVYMNLIYAMAIPIPSFILSVVYLAFAYFVLYAEEDLPRPRVINISLNTPVHPPTSEALTPNSEVFREDLASFGHDFKVAMADEASRDSVFTCVDAVPDSNSLLEGNKVSDIKPSGTRLAAVKEEYDDIESYPQPPPKRLNPQEVMRSSSSELLLDQQQELRRRKLLELVAPKKKKAPKRTCRQRVWFYTTSIVALTAVSAGSSLLFLVPLYVDPAISTLVADFIENPVTCVTTRREDHSGIFNCTWSSCREGCTSDMYKCTHIYVSYYNALISTPSYNDFENSSLNETNEGVLLVNIKGCGYPPDVNCGQFTATYGIEGAEFPCHYSRENRTVVMTQYDRDDQIQIIINYFAVPFIITVVSSVVLCIMHYDCQCSTHSTRRRRPRIENASDNSISQRVDVLIPHQEGLRPL